MKRIGRTSLLCLALTGPIALAERAAGNGDPPSSPPGEFVAAEGGIRVRGHLSGTPDGGFVLVPEGGGPPVELVRGTTVRFEAKSPDQTAGTPPFRINLGGGQRLSGKLASFDEKVVLLAETPGAGPIRVSREGVQSIDQRPGETLALLEGFETLESPRWARIGDPDLAAAPRLTGDRALRLPAGGASLTFHVSDPIGSGRLEAAVHDDGAHAAGQKWFIDLTFRSPDGPQTVRVVFGWSEESLAVESVGGPALAVQRLARTTGWHRLSLRFGPGGCDVAVDGNELAHGKGFDGPLVEVRIASGVAGSHPTPRGLSAHVDDLRLVRFAEPVGEPQIDVSQDEVRLISGDQLFGEVRSGTAERIQARCDGRNVSIGWGEVAGVHFRREATQGAPIRGLLARVSWRSNAGNSPADVDVLEGALTAVSPTALTLSTPYAGSVSIPRRSITELSVLGRGERLVIDPKAHHLGDEISTLAPVLDPPEPEGGVLERTFEMPHAVDGLAWIVVDVVQVAGESSELQYSALVKKGELRTNVSLNGTPFDYLNRHIASRNESGERIRLPIPKGLLHPGRNVLRFEQVGIASDPNYLDDLGVLGIALEMEPGVRPAGAGRD